jgi:hypothetical protein
MGRGVNVGWVLGEVKIKVGLGRGIERGKVSENK